MRGRGSESCARRHGKNDALPHRPFETRKFAFISNGITEPKCNSGPAMNDKALGQTGIRVSEIGLGTWQYKGGVDPLRVGMKCGACLIDTAESYGTEEIVGLAIRGLAIREARSRCTTQF